MLLILIKSAATLVWICAALWAYARAHRHAERRFFVQPRPRRAFKGLAGGSIAIVALALIAGTWAS